MTEDVEMGESAPEVKVAAPETTIEQESLKAFYRRVYPFEQMHAWLSYGDGMNPFLPLLGAGLLCTPTGWRDETVDTALTSLLCRLVLLEAGIQLHTHAWWKSVYLCA